MKSYQKILALLFCLSVLCCKEVKTENKEAVLEDVELPDSSVVAEVSTTTPPKKLFADEPIDYDEQVYVKFDPQVVLEFLKITAIAESRMVDSLLASELRENDSINKITKTSEGEGFEVYALFYNDIEIVYFYFTDDTINSIEIIDIEATPSNMIGPGLTFGDLRKAYGNLTAYGDEKGKLVVVSVDNSKFIMDYHWDIEEPIYIEDDIEILRVQF